MAQGYYTLEEAAGLLKLAVDELKMMARSGEVRSFQDRGTWRFRVQDIQELARQRGLGSEPDLVLGESLHPAPIKKSSAVKKSSEVRKSALKTGKTPPPQPPAPATAPEIFSFDLPADQESVGIGMEPLQGGQGASKKSGPKSGPKSPRPAQKSPPPGPRSPSPNKISSGVLTPPEPGSDSDVRLVNEDFGIEVDSDVRLSGSPPPAGKKSSGKLPGSRPSKLAPGQAGQPPQRRLSEVKPSPPDSGVRLVPMDSDSDVRIVGSDSTADEIPLGAAPPKSAADSDIRLEFDEPSALNEGGGLTEEIDLDAELQEQSPKAIPVQSAPPPKAEPAFPAQSPFELSETNFNLPTTGSSIAHPHGDLGSSDLDLTPAGESSSPVEPSSDDFDLPMPDDSDEFSLGDAPGKPVDSGISLEQESEGSDEIDFTLNVEDGAAKTPPPSRSPADSDSEFELTLGADDSSGEMSALEESSEFELTMEPAQPSKSAPLTQAVPPGSSSEFELTLDTEESSSEFELTIDASGESAAAPDLTSDSEFELQLEDTGLESSSEFELTIDDDLQLVPEEQATPQMAMDDDALHTDLDDAPLLDDESGSDVVTMEEDTGLEDSDFDIDVDADQESSSQVMALEDEEIGFDEDIEVGDKGAGFDDLDAAGGYGTEGAETGPVQTETVIVERDVYAAPWSAWPVIVMLPCVVVMFFIGLMGFELIQSLNGYQEPGYVTKTISEMLQIKDYVK